MSSYVLWSFSIILSFNVAPDFLKSLDSYSSQWDFLDGISSDKNSSPKLSVTKIALVSRITFFSVYLNPVKLVRSPSWFPRMARDWQRTRKWHHMEEVTSALNARYLRCLQYVQMVKQGGWPSFGHLDYQVLVYNILFHNFCDKSVGCGSWAALIVIALSSWVVLGRLVGFWGCLNAWGSDVVGTVLALVFASQACSVSLEFTSSCPRYLMSPIFPSFSAEAVRKALLDCCGWMYWSGQEIVFNLKLVRVQMGITRPSLFLLHVYEDETTLNTCKPYLKTNKTTKQENNNKKALGDSVTTL